VVTIKPPEIAVAGGFYLKSKRALKSPVRQVPSNQPWTDCFEKLPKPLLKNCQGDSQDHFDGQTIGPDCRRLRDPLPVLGGPKAPDGEFCKQDGTLSEYDGVHVIQSG